MILYLLAAQDIAVAQSATRNISTGDGDLDTADRILPDSDTIYESNYGSNTVEKFSLAGSDLGVFGRPVHPTGLVFDNAGNLYVSSDDPAGYSIEKFTPDGSGSIFAKSGLNGPHALVFDEAGNLYVANAHGNTIEKFTPEGAGSVFADANDGLENPLDLAFDRAGNLCVSKAFGGPTHTGSVERFTPDGVGSVFADSGFHTAYGLAFDSAGNLYVSNFSNSTIEEFSSAGTDLGVFARAGLNFPHGMIFDRAGYLYVANNGNSTIEKFSSTGADLGVFASTGSGPHFLALFRPNHLHFECEALKRPAVSAAYKILPDAGASGGAYGLLRATVLGDFVSYNVPVVAAGTYNVKAGIQTRNDKGIFQLVIAGVNQGAPQDEYSSVIRYEVRDLGSVTFPSAGDEAFQFIVTGLNSSSRGYTLAFDYIDLALIP